MVVGATNGAASTLATTAMTETDPWRGTTSGAQTACAAKGTARTGPSGARRVGNPAAIAAPHGLASTSRPRVATADRAKP